MSLLSLVSILPRMLVERQRWDRTEISPKETQRPCCVRQEGLWAPALLCLLSGPGMGGDSSARVFPHLGNRRLAEGTLTWLSLCAAATSPSGNDSEFRFYIFSAEWASFLAWNFVLALETHTDKERFVCGEVAWA